MQLHLVTKYFWSRIQRRASPTGSASPSYKIIWTSPSPSPPLHPRSRVCVDLIMRVHAFVWVCVPIALTKQSSQFSNSGFRDDNFPRVQSTKWKPPPYKPASFLSFSPRLFPSRRRRVFPQFSPIQWNYVDCDAPCSLEKGGEFTIEAKFNKSTVGEGRVGDYSKRLRIWFDT